MEGRKVLDCKRAYPVNVRPDDVRSMFVVIFYVVSSLFQK